jgi:hypothetical protein
MTPVVREIIDLGLFPVLAEAQESIWACRREFGTNDVAIYVHCDDPPPRAWCHRREVLHDLLVRTVPDAKHTIEKLSAPCPVTHFILVMLFSGTFYVSIMEVPLSTEGVMN